MVSVTSLSHWPLTSMYNMVGMSHCIAWVGQLQRKLVSNRCRLYFVLATGTISSLLAWSCFLFMFRFDIAYCPLPVCVVILYLYHLFIWYILVGLLLDWPCGPGQSPSPYPFTSPPSTLLLCTLVSVTFPPFPFLTRFIYFLAFSSLPILTQ